jgi:hypothetical protein
MLVYITALVSGSVFVVSVLVHRPLAESLLFPEEYGCLSPGPFHDVTVQPQNDARETAELMENFPKLAQAMDSFLVELSTARHQLRNDGRY